MKLGRDEVLMVPYKCYCFSARSAQGLIQGGAKMFMYWNTVILSPTELLDGCLRNLVGMKFHGPEPVFKFFGQICPGRIQSGAKIGHRRSPSSKNFFFGPEGYSDKPNA